ncbi:unnamed protein product, partial [Closterium sp. NIES-53]
KGEVPDVLIPWIRALRLQLRERFRKDLLVLRLHYDRGGEFSSDLLRDFFRGEGILQSFTLPTSPQQNGVAEHRIGLVMEVARTSMIHAAAPYFLWPFAVRYAVHHLNLWPRVSLPETSPTLRWTRKFYHPTSRRVLPSQDVMFDKSVPFYRLSPYRTAPLPPSPLFLASDLLPLAEPVEVTVDSGAAGGGATRGAASGGAESAGAEPSSAELASVELGGAEPKGAEPGGAESEGAESGGAEPRGTASAGGPAGASPRQSRRREPLSLRQLREWFALCTRLRSGSAGGGGSAVGGTGAGGARATSLVAFLSCILLCRHLKLHLVYFLLHGITLTPAPCATGHACRTCPLRPALSPSAVFYWPYSSLTVSTASPVAATVTARLPTACSFSLR